MGLDFTIKLYKSLLETLRHQGFSFLSFEQFLLNTDTKVIFLRHDVDALPINSLEFARTQAKLGIKGTFYFRAVPESWDEQIIMEIARLGHQIGYHYEDLNFASLKLKAQGSIHSEEIERFIVEIGIKSFNKNLGKLRKIVPVKTICMHGSPMSKWDSRLLWKYYDYRDFGIIGEPYFDINFDEVLYLTDTGRRWDGDSFNVRDKAVGGRRKAVGSPTDEAGSIQHFDKHKAEGIIPPTAHSPKPTAPSKFHSTFDIIRAANEGKLPDKIMMTFHPQRWTNKPIPWMKELVWQNCKNIVKYFIVRAGNR